MSTKNKLSQKGLEKIFGNNMDNLISEIEKNTEIKQEYAQKISIHQIIPNPYQPRKVFRDEDLQELALSIKAYGVIQPILVKPTINNQYYLIAGERRLRAGKIANLTEIPVIILNIDDVKMHEIALIENIQRVDLNPIEEATSFSKLLNDINVTQENLSARIGKSRSYISNSVRLLKLPKEVQTYLLENKLSMGHLKPLLALIDNPELIIKIANKAVNEKWNVRKIENYISSLHQHKVKIVAERPINYYLEDKIMEKLGTRVKISANKITISYTSVHDLNRILEILNLLDD